MAARRALWSRAVVVAHQEDGSGIHHKDDENVNPLLGFEHGTMVRERNVLVGCYVRLHTRIPLLDISHLFPGNVSLVSVSSFVAGFRGSLFSQIGICVLTFVSLLNQVFSLDNEANMSPPVQQAQGNRRVRRPPPSALSQTSRKRRQPEPTSEALTVRRVLPKFR